jgi:hypothetical protein
VIVRTISAKPPADKVTLEAFDVIVGPLRERGATIDNSTVPEKPYKLNREIVWLIEACLFRRKAGGCETAKSGGLGVTVTGMIVDLDRFPLLPVTVTK